VRQGTDGFSPALTPEIDGRGRTRLFAQDPPFGGPHRRPSIRRVPEQFQTPIGARIFSRESAVALIDRRARCV